MTQKERRSASLRAQKRFLKLEEFISTKSVAIYSPIRNEVDTALICSSALASGKQVLYPAVVGEKLEFRLITNQADLVCATFGICEPPQGAEVFDIETIDLFLVPGVAFDHDGRRIGYGKGFYDKTLKMRASGRRLIALCYDFQLVESIDEEPHDVLMDKIVTDRRVISCPRG